MLKLIERYVLTQLGVAFVGTLVALAGVVWVTQALRQMSLVTAKGQTLLVFLEISLLALPFLLVVIAPFAVLLAAIVTLNNLNAGSELVVLNASGGSRMVVLRPILALSLTVSAAMLVTTTWLAPAAQRALRTELTKINVDLIANLVRPGRFTEIEDGLTFHIRNRSGDGSLAGLLIDDARDPAIAYTYTADQAVVLDTPDRTLLVMRDGVIQRLNRKDQALSVVNFEAYAFDLSELTPQNSQPVFRPMERSMGELIAADPGDEYGRKNIARFRAEFHDRLSQPLLPLAFGMIVFLFLGDARTTRQGRGLAVAGAIAAAAALRGLHFGLLSASVGSAAATAAVYAVPAGVFLVGLLAVLGDRSLALPRPVEWLIDAVALGLQAAWSRFGTRRAGSEAP